MTIPRELQQVLVCPPDTLRGAVRFKGTRVPVQALVAHSVGVDGIEGVYTIAQSAGTVSAVQVGIRNHEGHEVNYVIRARTSDQDLSEPLHVTVSDEDGWRGAVHVTFPADLPEQGGAVVVAVDTEADGGVDVVVDGPGPAPGVGESETTVDGGPSTSVVSHVTRLPGVVHACRGAALPMRA